jgi:two-component system sensor histidine kinase YesM
MGRLKEVQKATKALADFFRVALSRGNEIISIQDEIDNIRNYMYIQRIRYSDILDYDIEVRDEILGYSILKMTLQPLVENSIYHGLKEKGSRGRILVQGWKDGNTIYIKVSDDGVGMSAERLQEVIHAGRDRNSKRQSFGLSSVDERIRLYFGEEYGLTVQSALQTGTEALIRIPAITQEDFAHDSNHDH